MPGLPGCAITDTFAVLSPSGTMEGLAGTITARASAAPLFVQQQGGAWVEHANTLIAAVDQGGAWTLVLPSQPNCDPATVTWTITLPDGMAWTGPVTAAMVTASQTAPLTLHDLKTTWGWAVARSSAVVALAPYVATQSALGMVAIDQNPASGYPVALTAPRLGAASGVAALDSHGFVPLAQLSASGGVSVKSYGAKGDGTTDDTAAIAAAAAALGAGPGVLFFPPGAYVTGAQTFGPSSTVRMQRGALLQHGAAALSISGTLDAGPYQIFSGTGAVVLAPGSVAHAYPEWWGARNGGASDTAAVQAAANAVSAPTNGGGVVRFLPATYHFSSSVECPPHVAFIGAGVDQNAQAGTVITLDSGVDGFTWTSASSNGKSVIGNLAISGGRHCINAGNTHIFVSYVHLFDIATYPSSGAGIHLQGNIEEWYVERWFHWGGICGIQMEDIATSGAVSYVDKAHFVNCVINGATNCVKWFCQDGNVVTFEHCVFNGAVEHAIWLDCGINNYRFVNCNTENTGGGGKGGNTTGSISSGSTALSVASAADFAIGDALIVRGAAAHGLDLATTIAAMSGTILTLADAAGTTVSAVRVTSAQYDDLYITHTVATIGNIAIVGGGWGSNYGRLRYWLNNTVGVNVSISADTGSITEAYDPAHMCQAFSPFTRIVRSSDQYLNWGRTIFAPSRASGNAGERASYPSTPGGDWEAVLRSSSESGAGSIGSEGWLFRVATTTPTGYVVAQIWPDGTLSPRRVNSAVGVMSGATPDVSLGAYTTANGSPTTVTSFANGLQGQEVTIIFLDGFTTIQNNASIMTGTGTDLLGAYGTSARFQLLNGVWYRTGGTA